MKYSMTAEYYVGERYRDDTPWYFPWSPNASGSGRIVQMLLLASGESVNGKGEEPSR